MDVFELRDRVVGDYAEYVRSFLTIRDPGTRAFVDGYLGAGSLWPEPLVQLNPAFEPGATIPELVAAGILHTECERIFQRDKMPSSLGRTLRLHRHQDEAIRAAQSGESYVLTTGTGSGKSLAYFIPIVDYVLKNGGSGRGIKAIVVYPMNALANSQEEELRKFLMLGYPEGRSPVSYARYTGQESSERKREVIDNPPDILLTNFVMLELLLTRPDERRIVEAAQGLQFLVLDELHTYRGRQGADVAMLVRRVRDRCDAGGLRCVGTSATVAGSGTREERQGEVAAIATKLFGQPVRPDHVIVETLQRGITRTEPTATELTQALLLDPASTPDDFERLRNHPLAAWAEQVFGLMPDASGRLERRTPRAISAVAAELASKTSVAEERCANHLRALLPAGYRATDPASGRRLFAFRLHQFIGRGDRVYATLEREEDGRQRTADAQVFAPEHRDKKLFPVAFCRECGAEYAVIFRNSHNVSYAPRTLSELTDEDGVEAGFLFLDPDANVVFDELAAVEDWIETDSEGYPRVRRSARNAIPRRVRVIADGREVESETSDEGVGAWYFPAPFRYCFQCRVVYASERERDFGKLAELATEGRSTATTILSLSTVRALRGEESLPPSARKLLSFTDNRQDASLQAGHFNDFVQVSLVRSALLAAVRDAGPAGLRHDEVAARTAEKMALDFEAFSSNPEARFAAKRNIEDAFRDVIGYLAYNDLRRGWRVTSPNLEQVGLLRIDYESLVELCASEDVWQRKHEYLMAASPERREQIARTVLDHLRRSLAIKVRYLRPEDQSSIKANADQYLVDPWRFDTEQSLNYAEPVILQRTGDPRDRRTVLGPMSLLGRYLRRASTWPKSLNRGERLRPAEYPPLAADLFEALLAGGLVERGGSDEPEYLLQAGAMRWAAGDGRPAADPVRAPGRGSVGRVNAFFRDYYELGAAAYRYLDAHEHTAQVPAEVRIQREDDFRAGTLPVLYCSPTMELGVDISDLNAVHMRNVPPTPANYAQRSGRAGRQGQPALVTYCTNGSPHDQFYFRRKERMVDGKVSPPRLELANEDLVRAHLQAVGWRKPGRTCTARFQSSSISPTRTSRSFPLYSTT